VSVGKSGVGGGEWEVGSMQNVVLSRQDMKGNSKKVSQMGMNALLRLNQAEELQT